MLISPFFKIMTGFAQLFSITVDQLPLLHPYSGTWLLLLQRSIKLKSMYPTRSLSLVLFLKPKIKGKKVNS